MWFNSYSMCFRVIQKLLFGIIFHIDSERNKSMTTKMTANRLLVAVAATVSAFASVAAEKAEIASPDGAIRFAIHVDERLGYEMSYRGATLVERSAMGFSFAGEKSMGEGMELVGKPEVETGLVEEWDPVVRNKHAHVKMGYSRMVVRLREKSSDRLCSSRPSQVHRQQRRRR